MNIHRAFVCAVAVVVFLAASPVFAQDYEIRLTRDARAGEKYNLTASGVLSEQMTMSAKGTVLQKNAAFHTMKLEGIVTVLEVDKLKEERKLRLDISKCLVSAGGNAEEQEVLKKGTQVVAQIKDGQEEFLVDGNVAPKDVAKLLGHFISLRAGQVNDDHIFGTKERKKVGDSWPVNSVKAAADLSTKGMKVSPENIKGNTMLEKLVVVDGRECLKLDAKIDMSNISLPLPSGLTVEKSDMSATFSGEFPVDVSIRRLSEQLAMTVAITAKGKPNPDIPEITLFMTMERSRSMKWKLIE
jgi:hypothetical protein